MTIQRFFRLSIPAAMLLICSTGCQLFAGKPDKPAAPTTAPTAPPPAGSQTYDGSAQYGITIVYPAGFKPGQIGTSIFSAIAPTGSIKIFLDYHKLNFVEAGFANIKLVDDNYQSDRKKNWAADAVVSTDSPVTIPDSDARKVQLAGHDQGKAAVSIAALIIHSKTVYVITVECDPADAPAAGKVFDQVVASIRWK